MLTLLCPVANKILRFAGLQLCVYFKTEVSAEGLILCLFDPNDSNFTVDDEGKLGHRLWSHLLPTVLFRVVLVDDVVGHLRASLGASRRLFANSQPLRDHSCRLNGNLR